MNLVFAATLRLGQGLAFLCCVLLAFITFAIVVDVTLRDLGYQPFAWTVPVTEYVLLYVAVLGMPYMTRHKGHILVEALIENVPDRAHLVMAKFVYLVCTVLCVALAYRGALLAWESWSINDMDYRSIDTPRWILDVTMPIGFGLSAVEFLRYLLGYDTMYRVKATEKDGF